MKIAVRFTTEEELKAVPILLFLPLSDKEELKRALRQAEILIIERDVQAL